MFNFTHNKSNTNPNNTEIPFLSHSIGKKFKSLTAVESRHSYTDDRNAKWCKPYGGEFGGI